MSTIEKSRISTPERFGKLEPGQFQETVEALNQASARYLEVTADLVEQGLISPYQGAQVNAAIVASIWGVHEFPPQSPQTPLVLSGAMLGQRQ